MTSISRLGIHRNIIRFFCYIFILNVRFRTDGLHYPEQAQVDKIYGTNANRSWYRERGVRTTGVPKGKGERSSTKGTGSMAGSGRPNRATS